MYKCFIILLFSSFLLLPLLSKRMTTTLKTIIIIAIADIAVIVAGFKNCGAWLSARPSDGNHRLSCRERVFSINGSSNEDASFPDWLQRLEIVVAIRISSTVPLI